MNKPSKAKWLLQARVDLILNIIYFFHILYLCAPFDSYSNERYFPWPHMYLLMTAQCAFYEAETKFSYIMWVIYAGPSGREV